MVKVNAFHLGYIIVTMVWTVVVYVVTDILDIWGYKILENADCSG